MIRRIAKINLGRAAPIIAGLMLAAGALAAVQAPPASAASSVVSWWNVGGVAKEQTGSVYPCGKSWQINQNGTQPLEVYNPCSGRVWVHVYDYSAGKTYAYCVNPGGGLAYPASRFPPWRSGDGTDIQLSANTSACDSGQTFAIWWESASTSRITTQVYACEALTLTWTGEFVEEAYNQGCDTRLWLHEYDSGTGATYCVDPGTVAQLPADAYWQVEMVSNQAPCNAGGPPYPY